MQSSWEQGGQQGRNLQPKFTQDEVSAFLDEVSLARDRESFNRLIVRFDSQFLSKFKARFPSQSGRFPFGSVGKPYTYGTPQSNFQSYPHPYDQPYARPQTGAYDQYPTDRRGTEGMQMYQPPQYRAQTPAPMMPNFGVRAEQPYSAPMYDRPAEYRPQSSYPDYYQPYPSQPPSAPGQPPYPSNPQTANQFPSKSNLTSLSDYAILRKSQEDSLTRFQTGAQRPPKA